MINNVAEPGRAATAVPGPDVAHHVLDPDGVSGLDETRATALVDALPQRRRTGVARAGCWPCRCPGRLGVLRGPGGAEPGRARRRVRGDRTERRGRPGPGGGRAGRAVAAATGPSDRPRRRSRTRPSARSSETILQRRAERWPAWTSPAGPTPRPTTPTSGPAPGYSPRQRAAADRAARLLLACRRALDHDGGQPQLVRGQRSGDANWRRSGRPPGTRWSPRSAGRAAAAPLSARRAPVASQSAGGYVGDGSRRAPRARPATLLAAAAGGPRPISAGGAR